MKQIPNTPHGWAWFVEQVKSMIDYNLTSDDYSIMMREYYIRGKKPEDFVNRGNDMTETKDSAFSEFFRNATEEEKRKVYQEVMEKATESQLDTLKETEENNEEKQSK